MNGKSDRIMISKYTTLIGVEEDQRLDVQNSVLCHFDRDVYDKVLRKKDCPAILDVGCGTGNMIWLFQPYCIIMSNGISMHQTTNNGKKTLNGLGIISLP